MFINFWYAADWSDKLKEQPLKVKMLRQHFVLFRDAQGDAHCLANACPHRGGSLANGMVVDGDIECPYHGMRYGGDGLCTRIPSLGRSTRPPARAKVDSYPVQEKYGLIFVFLGDLPEEERPPIMDVPQWDDPKYRFTIKDNLINANYGVVMENGLDTTHTEFVHSDIMSYRGADRPGGEVAAAFPPAPGWGKFLNKALGVDKIFSGSYVVSGYWGANALDTSVFISKDMNLHIPQYLWETPIDEFTTPYAGCRWAKFFQNTIVRPDRSPPQPENRRTRYRDFGIARTRASARFTDRCSVPRTRRNSESPGSVPDEMGSAGLAHRSGKIARISAREKAICDT